MLQSFVTETSNNIREIDILARWGGEEFVILWPNTNKEEAIIVAEKIRKLIDEAESKELKDITISVGVSEVNPEKYDIKDSINPADQAMYMAKRNGRNKVYLDGFY